MDKNVDVLRSPGSKKVAFGIMSVITCPCSAQQPKRMDRF